MRQETIAERAAAIRLSPSFLSRATGKTAHTIGRTLNGRTRPFHETMLAIERVIEAEELRLRDYLNTLHPIAPAGGALPAPGPGAAGCPPSAPDPASDRHGVGAG